MDRRSEPRIPVELPIRIWGVDSLSRPFSEVARVKNVSEDGALLEGVQSKLKAGEILDVQYGPYRAQFQIVWFGKAGSYQQGEVVLKRLPLEQCIWDIDLAASSMVAGNG